MIWLIFLFVGVVLDKSLPIYVTDDCYSVVLLFWGLSTTTTTSFMLVYLVVVRWSKYLYIISYF
jgi:hypothetical protein